MIKKNGRLMKNLLKILLSWLVHYQTLVKLMLMTLRREDGRKVLSLFKIHRLELKLSVKMLKSKLVKAGLLAARLLLE